MGRSWSRRQGQVPAKSIWRGELSAGRFGRAGHTEANDASDAIVDAIAVVRESEAGWHLEIMFSNGLSIAWDEPFPTQLDALQMLDQFCQETSAVEIQIH